MARLGIFSVLVLGGTLGILIGCNIASVTAGTLRLEQIHVVFRHGNRTPQFPYPNDPNKDNDWYPMGWDQLSQQGMEPTHRLGRYVREKYSDFLGDVYTLDVVNATSTASPRAKQCLQLFMAGLFPPKNIQQWGPDGGLGTLWQPFIYNYMPEEYDNIFYMKNPCPRYTQEYEDVKKNSEFTKNVVNSDKEMVDTVVEKSGIERNLHAIEGFHCTIRIETFHNLTVPEWVSPFYPDRLRNMGKYHFQERVLTRTMQRLLGGPMVGYVMDRIQDVERGVKSPRTHIYSGHDDTVTAFGISIGAWENLYPDFNSMIILELLRDESTKEFFVQAKVRESHAVELHLAPIKGCETPCSLKKFRGLVKDVVPEDWAKECNQLSSGAVGRVGMVSTLLLWVAALIRAVDLASLD